MRETPNPKMATTSPGGRNSQKVLREPFPLKMGSTFAWRGRIISGRLGNRFGSRFGTNTNINYCVELLALYPNDYLNTVLDDVVSLFGSCRSNALPRSPREKLSLVAILSLRMKSLSLQEKNNYAICRSPRRIETYSLG